MISQAEGCQGIAKAAAAQRRQNGSLCNSWRRCLRSLGSCLASRRCNCAADSSTVRSSALNQNGTVEYDSLILATGAAQSYFGHPEFAEHAPGMKTIDDALELRGRIFGAFEMAERESDLDRRRSWLTFAVVGAGPTGVELAGQLIELSRRSLRHNFQNIEPHKARVVLIDALNTVLPAFHRRRRRGPGPSRRWPFP